MDLSFARLEAESAVAALPTGLAVLMVGVAARQAASPTARLHASLPQCVEPVAMAPRHGAFNEAMAVALIEWQQP